MIINKSTVDLAAQHLATRQNELSLSLRAWIGAARPDFESLDNSTTAQISAAALAALKDHPPNPAPAIVSSEAQAISDAIDQADQDPIIHLIRLMVEMLTGHKIGSLSVKAVATASAKTATATQAAPAAPAAPDCCR